MVSWAIFVITGAYYPYNERFPVVFSGTRYSYTLFVSGFFFHFLYERNTVVTAGCLPPALHPENLQAAYRLRYIQKIQIFLTVYLFIYYEFHSKNCHFQVSSPN